jgi:hypothetical protein
MTPEEKFEKTVEDARWELKVDRFLANGDLCVFHELQEKLVENWHIVRKQYEDGIITEEEYKDKRFTECSGMYADKLVELGLATGTFTAEESQAYMDANWLLEKESGIVIDNDADQYDACYTAFMEMRKWYIDFHTQFTSLAEEVKPRYYVSQCHEDVYAEEL